jgi:flagellar P-ring protein precursor FlgI
MPNGESMNRIKTAILILLVSLMFIPLAQAVRIKDIAEIEGVRSNKLVGYGLVIGLNGTGDKAGTEFTIQSLVNMLERMGVKVDRTKVKVENVAAVMVTADLPPFSRQGTRIDALVSSIGDAESLQGGTLVLTPLKGPDGLIYAVAQGPISIGGGFAASGAAASVQKNHPTVGRIVNGTLIEREVPLPFRDKRAIHINLRQPDFTTALRLAEAVNTALGGEFAIPLDGGTVRMEIPPAYRGDIVELVASVETLNVTPDRVARVVFDEKTGTVVIGEGVRISAVAISHGNLSMVIKERPEASQPLPFSEGETVVTPNTQLSVKEEKASVILMPEGVSIQEVVSALNAIGVSPRDLIAIFQALKEAGALQAELKIM